MSNGTDIVEKNVRSALDLIFLLPWSAELEVAASRLIAALETIEQIRGIMEFDQLLEEGITPCLH